MSGGFVKIYGSKLLKSTLWLESIEARLLFIGMLAEADEHGVVDISSVKMLAHRMNMTVEQTEKGLEVLEAPDPESRTDMHDGRRVIRQGGTWHIVTHGKYRDMRTERQEQDRIRKLRDRSGGRDADTADASTPSMDTADASRTSRTISDTAPEADLDLEAEEEEGERASAPAPAAPPPEPIGRKSSQRHSAALSQSEATTPATTQSNSREARVSLDQEGKDTPSAGGSPAADPMAWEMTSGAVCLEHRVTRPRGTRDQERQAAQRVADMARTHGVTRDAAADRLARAALAAAMATQGGLRQFPFLCLTLDPFAAGSGARPGGPTDGVAPAGETFEQKRARYGREVAEANRKAGV